MLGLVLHTHTIIKCLKWDWITSLSYTLCWVFGAGCIKVPELGDRRRFLLPSSEMQLHGSNVFYWHSLIIDRRKKGKMQLEKTLKDGRKTQIGFELYRSLSSSINSSLKRTWSSCVLPGDEGPAEQMLNWWAAAAAVERLLLDCHPRCRVVREFVR